MSIIYFNSTEDAEKYGKACNKSQLNALHYLRGMRLEQNKLILTMAERNPFPVEKKILLGIGIELATQAQLCRESLEAARER